MKKQYVDIEKHWNKIKPYAVSDIGTMIWKQGLEDHCKSMIIDLHKSSNNVYQTESIHVMTKFDKKYSHNKKPADYSCYILIEGESGRPDIAPEFWNYIVSDDKHFGMVNFELYLAKEVFPEEPWRIIISEEHACVWNGKDLLFDMYYSALIPNIAEHPFYEEFDEDVRVLSVGEELNFNISEDDVKILDLYDAGQISIHQVGEYFFNTPSVLMKKQYVDIEKNWNKIKPYAVSAAATQIWKKDLKKHYNRSRIYDHNLSDYEFNSDRIIDRFIYISQFEKRFSNSKKPSDYDYFYWRYERLGFTDRMPAFWDYVVHDKSHWMVNFNLFVAEQAFPEEPWRIIVSDEHACVWNGRELFFDMNYSALIPDVKKHPFYDKLGKNVRVLAIGEKLKLSISDDDNEMLASYDAGQISVEQVCEYFFNNIYYI